jgi:hypothetical protein
MKKIFVLILAGFSLISIAQGYQKTDNSAFKNGEKLTFRIAYNSTLTGSLTAGKATLEILPSDTIINNQSTIHAVAKAWTTGLIEVFYKLNNRLESYINPATYEPVRFVRSLRENKYRKEETINFNHKDLTAVHEKKMVKIIRNTQDVISILYFVRSLSVENINPGQYFQVPYFLDDSIFHSRIIYEGKEKIKTRSGIYNCIKLKPMVLIGNVFNDTYPMTIWLTDDNYRLPVLIKSKLKIGEAHLELMDSGNQTTSNSKRPNRK